MRHGILCAIGHNLADSLGSGMCFVIGMWSTNVFGEAANAEEAIEVDFLNGQIIRGACSENLQSAVKRFGEILPDFCRANGADVTHFTGLSASFHATSLGPRVSLHVADRSGKCSTTEYSGYPLKRVRAIDPQGRVRRSPRQILARADARPLSG